MNSNTNGGAKKSLGQHWLNDPAAVVAMLDAGMVERGDNILEIGPGQGVMTVSLLEAGARVTAVEFDLDLYHDLKRFTHKTDGENLNLIHGDILNFDLSIMPSSYKVIANIPYYITAPIIRILLEAANQPSHIALLVQKEVAERICAGPGKMSILAVSAQFYASCSLAEVVPAKSFTPAPKVDSQILVMTPYKKPLLDVDNKKYFKLVRAGFSEKRKKLVNSLSGGLQLEKTDIAKIINSLGWSENIRAQELSLEQWNTLYSSLLARL